MSGGGCGEGDYSQGAGGKGNDAPNLVLWPRSPSHRHWGQGQGEEWTLALQLPDGPCLLHTPMVLLGPGVNSMLIRFTDETKLGGV